MRNETDCVSSETDMAAGCDARDPVENLCEEATCSICLEYFKDPVSLECEHNFCRHCVTQCWEKSGNSETSCPQCRKEVLQSNLRPNRLLANMVEIAKKLNFQGPKREEGKGRVCGKHQEPLKLFCKDDDVSICVVCDRSKEHRSHTVIPMEEAAQETKDLMVNHQTILEKVEEKVLEYKAEIEKESQDVLKQTEAEMENILVKITEIRQFLEEQEKRMEEMKKQIARERDENLAMFDQEHSSLKNLIQELKEKCQQPPAELLQDVKSLLQRSQEKKTFEKPVAFSEELKLKIWELYNLKPSLDPLVKQLQDTLLPGLELQKANVTLDPDTAGSYLVLSEDRKSVRHEGKDQNLPDNPERFKNSTHVLGCEGFTRGSHFWDVVAEGKGHWFVGVARKSVRRKCCFLINPSDGIWAISSLSFRFHAPRIPSISDLSLREKVRRVRVCLNCAANRVAFYDADTGDQIHAFSEVPFSTETVLPFFSIFSEASLKISP
ncbi:E3 ubiquitin-protein ligase TRIM7-like [Anolis sagrei]|uniref:E3 ubiquitin-protein ligase TRIM7-like n=1 Tax=Anolis sagrei TaxID=38937 RepID=UPI003520A082